MAKIETWVGCDLDKAVQVRQLGGFLFTQDNEGNLLGAKVTQEGEPVNLTGTIVGYAILADGQTVDITGDSTGIQDGNGAYIILPQLAYSVPGQISIVIKLTTADTITTLAAFCGYVYRSKTGNEVVPPGTPVPDLSTLEEAIRNANTAATAANTAAAAAENVDISMSQDGDLITITTTDRQGETKTSTLTDQSEAVSGLKSAFEQLNDNVITESAGPAPIVSIADGADGMPMRQVEVAIEPVQDLHGYDSPWPAGGGTNQWNEDWEAYGTSQIRSKTRVPVIAGATYFWCGTIVTAYEFENLTDSSIGNMTIQPDSQVTIPSGVNYLMIYSATGYGKTYLNNWALNYPATVTTYSPYSNICPISGWTGVKVTRTGKNLFNLGLVNTSTGRLTVDGTTISKMDSGYSVDVFSGSQGSAAVSTKVYLLKAGTYTISGIYVGTGSLNVYKLGDDAKAYGDRVSYINESTTSRSFTLEKDYYITLRYSSQPACTVTDLQIELGSTATAYKPYQGQTYEVTFPTEAGTVYGGTLDVASGRLVVDRAIDTLNDKTLLYADGSNISYRKDYSERAKYSDSYTGLVCSCFPASDGYSSYVRWRGSVQDRLTFVGSNMDTLSSICDAGTLQVSYTIATPVSVDLTPQELETLLGVNNVWADAGNTAITYPADTKMYIDRKITEAVANALNA